MDRDFKWMILGACIGATAVYGISRLRTHKRHTAVSNSENTEHMRRCPPWLLPAEAYKSTDCTNEHILKRDALVAELFDSPLDDASSNTEFGPNMLQYFTVDKQLTHLNHGGYGGCLLSCLERRIQLLKRMEACPQRFEEYENLYLQGAALRELGAFLNTDPDNLVFVPNTTTGANTVAANIPFVDEGDEVLHLQDGYLAVRNALDLLCERRGAKLVFVPLRMDEHMCAETVMETVKSCISPRTKFAVMDHVLSINAAVLPIKYISILSDYSCVC